MANPIFAGVDRLSIFVEGGPPVVIDSNATVTDPDLGPGDNYAGAKLIVAGPFTFGASGTLSFTGADEVRIGGVLIGTYADAFDTRTITFNAGALAADVNSVLQQLTYTTASAALPPGAAIRLDFETADAEFTFNLVRVLFDRTNDAPVLAAVAPSAGYLAGAPAITLSPGVTVADVNSPTLAGATVRLVDGIDGDTLTANVGLTGIGAVYDAATRTLTLSGGQTLAEYQEVLATVAYSSSSGDPTNAGANATRTIEWEIDDGGSESNLSAVQTTTLSFTAGSVIPFIDLDQSRPGTGYSAGTGSAPVRIADVDTVVASGGTQIISATVVLTNATVGDTLSLAAGSTLPAGITSTVDTSVAGQITLTLSGAASAADYQVALEQVVFDALGLANPLPRDIAVTVSNGNLSNTAHVRVNIGTLDDAYQAFEDRVLVVSALDGVRANDAASLVLVSDQLTTSAGGSIDFAEDGSFVYAPPPGFSGIDTVVYQAGSGGLLTATLTIAVAPVADSPSLRLSDSSVIGFTPVGTAQTVTVPGASYHALPAALLALPDGGFAMALTVSNFDSGSTLADIYIQVFGADGAPSGPPLQLDGADQNFNLQLARLPNGFAAVWRSEIDPEPVSFRLFDEHGAPTGPAVSFGDPSTLDGGVVGTTALSNGNFAITYVDDIAGTLVRLFDPAGAPVAGPVTLADADAPRSVRIAPDLDGGFVATRTIDHGGGVTSVVAQRYDADGSLDGAEIVIRPPGVVPASILTPSLASLGEGRFVVVWGEQVGASTPTVQRLYAQVVGADNQPVGGVIDAGEIHSTQIFGTFSPRVTALADGFVIARETSVEFGSVENDNGAIEPFGTAIAAVMQVFDRNGVARSGEFIAEMNPGLIEIGSARATFGITPLPDGGFMVGMTDYREAPPDFDSIIQVFDSHGRRIGNVPFMAPALDGDQRGPLPVLLANGDLALAWSFNTQFDVIPVQTQILQLSTTATMQEGGSIVLPLEVEFNDLDGSEALKRIEIAGVPAGWNLTGPAGTTLTQSGGIWTMTGNLGGPLSITVAPTGDANGAFTLILKGVVQDGAGGPEAAGFMSVPIAIAAVNDAPVNVVPGAQEVEANTNTPIAGLAVTDVDAGIGLMTTTLSVAHGTLIVESEGGASVTGSGSGTVQLTGSLDQINITLAAANNVVYRGATDFFGTDTLTMVTDDGGNSGTGGALTDTDQVTINLNRLTGTPGDDSYTIAAGNVRIDALGGVDTVAFGFRLVDATVTYVGNTIIIDGPSTHAVLTGFERYVFTDGTVDNNDGNWLLDDLFYYSKYHDVWNAHADADQHYASNGWQEGRDPDAFFSTAIYLSANPDVKAAGVDPLAHYGAVGWTEGRLPSVNFDPAQYLAANPDVAAAHVDPLVHFLRFGAGEGRLPFAPGELVTANGFDYVFYLNNNPDVAASGADPFHHFMTVGWTEGRDPNALFDVNGYLANYADVDATNVNPLAHYSEFGWHEGRDPSTGFDTTSYLAAYPDVEAAGVNPLSHFLAFGIHEGRSAFPDGVWG